MTKLYSSPAEKAKWEAMRTTPRGRGLVLSRVVDPGRIDIGKQSLKPRVKRREAGRAAFALRIQREREIGIDPVYAHGSRDQRYFRAEWLKTAKAWDIAHQPKPDQIAA